MSPVETYAALLAEEHAAVHLYGVLAPRLPEGLRDAAAAAYDDHRRHRDALTAAIRAAGGTPPAARVTYALPFRLSTPSAARSLADRIESSLLVRWHNAVRDVDAKERGLVAGCAADEAEHLAILRWAGRHLANEAAATFPGR